MIHTVQLDQVAPQPWRNGGGSTRELLTWPAGTDWHCRISVARIEQDGPFSAYPGVERWFTVLQGSGVMLRFGDRDTVLTAASEPLRFEGSNAPACCLLDGATQDLNLMVRGDAGSGSMRVIRSGHDWTSSATLRAVFAAETVTLQIDGGDCMQLSAGTLAFAERAQQQRWSMRSPRAQVRAWWLQFTAHAEAGTQN